MEDKTIIETGVRWSGSSVFTTSSDKSHSIQVIGMAGLEKHPIAWSPVHMFVSSIESCYFATLQATFERARIDLSYYSSRAVGELTSEDGKNKAISKVTIYVEAGLENPNDQEKAKTLMEKTEKYCYVARSIKCPVSLEIKFR